MKNNKELLQELVTIYKTLDESFDKLNDLMGVNYASPLAASVWNLLDITINLLTDKINDNSTWLAWYIFENDCGDKALEAGIDDNTKKIKTIDDLLWVIKLGAKNEKYFDKD